MSTNYPSNLSDTEWECLQRHLPPQPKRGRPPTHSLRVIFDAILLRPAHWLRVALLTLQLPALANGVLPFPTLAPQRHLVSSAHNVARGRTRASRQECTPECDDHGCTERQNRRGISRGLRL